MAKLDLLLEKVKKRKAFICVLGLGRVGLPLASVLANAGFHIIGVDINKQRLESIKNTKTPFFDPALQENLSKAISTQNFEVQTKISNATNPTDVIFLTVGTPNTVEGNIDYSQLYTALEETCSVNLDGKMIILRSTLPPKTCLEIIVPYLENKTALKCGSDFALAVCPERILEGQAIKELHELPEIIGGFNQVSNEIAKEIFLSINPKKEILITSPSGAELAKLFTNIYRYISFALANEFAVWSEIYGVDATELIKIANHNYPRCNIPIPGFAGGPCLSKDGTFLDNNTTFSSIVSTAWKLNESIPRHIVNRIKKTEGNLFNKRITVLGISFKAGSDDLRNSPSQKLIEILQTTGAKISVHDPFVKNTMPLSEVFKNPDIVILATNHKEFKNIVNEIREAKPKVVYDVWGMYKKGDFPNSKYLRFGQGL